MSEDETPFVDVEKPLIPGSEGPAEDLTSPAEVLGPVRAQMEKYREFAEGLVRDYDPLFQAREVPGIGRVNVCLIPGAEADVVVTPRAVYLVHHVTEQTYQGTPLPGQGRSWRERSAVAEGWVNWSDLDWQVGYPMEYMSVPRLAEMSPETARPLSERSRDTFYMRLDKGPIGNLVERWNLGGSFTGDTVLVERLRPERDDSRGRQDRTRLQVLLDRAAAALASEVVAQDSDDREVPPVSSPPDDGAASSGDGVAEGVPAPA